MILKYIKAGEFMNRFEKMADDCTRIIADLMQESYSCAEVDGMLDVIKTTWYYSNPVDGAPHVDVSDLTEAIRRNIEIRSGKHSCQI